MFGWRDDERWRKVEKNFGAVQLGQMQKKLSQFLCPLWCNSDTDEYSPHRDVLLLAVRLAWHARTHDTVSCVTCHSPYDTSFCQCYKNFFHFYEVIYKF